MSSRQHNDSECFTWPQGGGRAACKAPLMLQMVLQDVVQRLMSDLLLKVPDVFW